MADGEVLQQAKFHAMTESTMEDWAAIGRAAQGHRGQHVDQIVNHLNLLKGDTGGFAVDRLEHSLQTATRAHQAGQDEEYVVCARVHDIGDMLVHAGFADPVMDMEYITLTYADVRAVMHDLKAFGAHNVTAGRRQGMTARATCAAVERNYEGFRQAGRLPATFEVIYGHAWLPQKRTTPDGRRVIDIKLAA